MLQQQAHTNMIKQQLRTNGATDTRLLAQFEHIAREDFVPTEAVHLAYADRPIPLAHHQIMLRPFQQAIALQALALQKTDRVLEIGTGTGYLTAIMANLSQHVLSVDEFPDFVNTAQQHLAHYDIHNVTLAAQDAFQHWQEIAKQGPFDVILCTAGFYTLPDCLQTALVEGGRLFVIVGNAPTMTAKLLQHETHQRWQVTSLFETEVPYANGINQPDAFQF